jgi:hypothetical protein
VAVQQEATMKHTILLILLMTSHLGFGQNPSTNIATPNAGEVNTWTPATERIFQDDPRMGIVKITTQWVQTSERSGTLRYRVSITAERAISEHTSQRGVSKFFDQIIHCDFHLNLADANRFLIDKIPLPFTASMDDSGETVGVEANSEYPMPPSEYVRFWGTKEAPTHGMWSLGKSCPAVELSR